MNKTTINMAGTGGPVIATITCPDTPQSVVGVIWRYNADLSFDKKVGLFKTDSASVTLGSPAEIAGKLFLIEGTVINEGDDPPTPYKVTVDVGQDGNILKSEVPADGGSGTIGDKDIAFVYRFTLQST